MQLKYSNILLFENGMYENYLECIHHCGMLTTKPTMCSPFNYNTVCVIVEEIHNFPIVELLWMKSCKWQICVNQFECVLKDFKMYIECIQGISLDYLLIPVMKSMKNKFLNIILTRLKKTPVNFEMVHTRRMSCYMILSII